MSPTLRTARLLLDEYTPADEESFVALLGDERVARWMGDGPEPQDALRALFHRVFDVYRDDRFDVWAVRMDGRHLGHAELKRTDTVDGHELIYAVEPRSWGRGLGTEVAAELVRYAFEVLRLPAVHATVDAANAGSLALLGRLGFVPVRDLHEDGGAVTRVLTLAAGHQGTGPVRSK